jgi:hypothetical protein
MYKTALALTVILLGISGTATPRAEQPLCYTLASLEGPWTIVSTFGANVAKALGKRDIAGDGSFTGTFLLNGPTAGSPTGARTITTGTQVGTYAVNCDGTGTITRVVTASNGTQATQIDDIVITAAEVRHHDLIATAVVDVQRVPSALVAGGIFVTREMTRVPDERERDRR